ncbi:MAG: DNA alkylation repair protein [Bacteroidales bacterium]|nr:DNA alkylation repair protein [Bacteroidales bacterium]
MMKYLNKLIDIFEKNANLEKAVPMKKYMKDKFEYFGIMSENRRKLIKIFISENGIPEKENLKKIIHQCWECPQRELQYFGMELVQKHIKTSEKEIIEILEFMIITKSWWDTIDYIAANSIGVLFKRYPEMIIPFTEKWMDSGNMWLQRSAILFQLKYKEKTDTELLFKYSKRLSGSKEFFIRKAIGWALREYSKTKAEEIIKFVSENELSPLSKKEALRRIDKN